MKIAVLSGKGGTGKTFISTNLAYLLSQKNNVQLLDCDVEEPNDHIFLSGKLQSEQNVVKKIPIVEQSSCNHCGICAKECQFGAIAAYPAGTVVFKNLCHGCGLCTALCPEKAITEIDEPIGKISESQISESLTLSSGLLKIGEPSPVPVIRELKKHLQKDRKYYIFDSPPGASCPVVETLRGMQYAILVTESSPFGLHDLKNVIQIVREMNIPHGVIINRYDSNFHQLETFLETEQIPVLLKIPFNKMIAQMYSLGKLYCKSNTSFADDLLNIVKKIEDEIDETNSHH